MTTLPANISTLTQQIGALTEKLAPVTDEYVAKALKSLLSIGLALPSGMAEDKATEIYTYALQGVPAYGVQKATAGIIRGAYDIHPNFLPTPPQFAAIARLETKVFRDELLILRERMRAMKESAAPRHSSAPSDSVPPVVAQMHAKYRHRKVLAENVDMGAFKPAEWPAGTCFVPILGKVFAADEKRPPRPYHEPKGE